MHENHRPHEIGVPTRGLPGDLSRRNVLALILASFVAGCSAVRNPTASPHVVGSTDTPTSTAPSVLQPAEPIQLRNVRRVVPLAVLDAGGADVVSVAWSPGAHLLAAGAYRTLQLWDPVTGKQVAALPGHSDSIWWVTWSPDGSQLASASQDGTVRLWDTRRRATLRVLQGHSDTLLSVAWSPDGTRLLAGNIDGTLDLWDANTGKHLAAWTGHSPEPSGKGGAWALAVFAAAWSPDGQRIASTREDNIVQLWEARTGRVLSVLQTNVGSANIVAWSPDGHTLAVSNDLGSVQLWNAQTGKNLALLDAHPDSGWANMVVWSPDGRMLLSTRRDGTVQLWDARGGKELIALQGHTSEVWGAAWSPDGLRLASGSRDTTIRLWGVR